MSADRISFDKQEGIFVIDNQCGYNALGFHNGAFVVAEFPNTDSKPSDFTPGNLGKIVGEALVSGAKKIQFDSVTLSVDYIVQMLRFTGKHGWFSDLLSSTVDHAFDANKPTPGLFVGEAHQLLEEASLLDRYELLARSAYQFDEADDAAAKASALRQTAHEKLTRQ